MICPECEGRAKCKDTRQGDGYRWRRYHCPFCTHRFTTSEMIDNAPDPRLKPREKRDE